MIACDYVRGRFWDGGIILGFVPVGEAEEEGEPAVLCAIDQETLQPVQYWMVCSLRRHAYEQQVCA